MHSRSSRHLLLSALLFCFMFVFVAGAALIPYPAYAIPVEETGAGFWGARTAQLTVMQSIWASAIVGVVNAATLFAQQFAYDLAVGLASGFKGQNPFAFLDEPGTYFTKLTYDAAGEVISNLSGPWEELGLNLCSPRLPEVGLSIQLGLALGGVQRPTPKCDFVRTVQNWQAVVRQAQNPQQVLSKLSLSFDPAQSDLGQAFRAQEAVRIGREAKKQAAFVERIEGLGVLPQKTLIGGQITTPATVINKNFQGLAEKGEGSSEPPAGIDVLKAVGGGNVWLAAGQTVLSTFTNTLISRVLQMGLQGLFSLGPPEERPDLTQLVGAPAGERGGGSARASAAAVGLLAASIRTQPSFDITAQLAACPQDRKTAGQFNCTVDQQFMVAVQQATAGSPLTVKEAVEKRYLDRAKPFGFVDPATGREPDYSEGYPYSSLKRLRLLRILPLGWEFAALRIRNDGAPATLGDVLDGWEGTGPDGQCGTPDDTSRFCGLLDPNWILKAPSISCGATVFGASLDATGTGRQEVCADVRHCIAEDERGNCRASGYCTRERNVWKFDGDPCEPQFASCDTFRPAQGTGQGQEVSLLETTLDFGVCNAENAGCAAYARDQSPIGTWVDIADPAQTGRNRIYLDNDAGVCEAASDGCSEFIPASPEANATLTQSSTDPEVQYAADTPKVYFRAPPAYLGCTGEEGEPAACANFARICRPAEAGCERYSPIDGDPAVPGIVSATDRCSAECVGYNTYLKQGSAFEPRFGGENPYLIIPARSRACSAAESGCDEFTNLATEQREYFSQLRACQSPAPDSQTFFTWEGSDTTGYQLKTWSLKLSNLDFAQAGFPLEADVFNLGAGGELRAPCTNYELDQMPDGQLVVNCADNEENSAVCNPADPNLSPSERADCRSFYDSRGNIFPRKFSRTVVSSEECRAFRWSGLTSPVEVTRTPQPTRPQLEAEACEAGNGFWNETTSQCLYLGVPSLSRACSAQSSGCRGYRGNTGSNVAIIFEETFEGTSSMSERGWSPEGASLSSSAEELTVNERSLKVEGAFAGQGVIRTLAATESAPALVSPGSTYFVSFLAKGSAGMTLQVLLGEVSFSTIALTPEWRTFSLGPVTAEAEDQELLFLRRAGGPAGAATFFLDDVLFKRLQDTVYLVKNSWDIPASCDRLPEEVGGGQLRGAAVGCESYRDRAGATQTLKSFSSLCREQSVGCTDLIDTRGSDLPAAQTFNTENEADLDDLTVPQDARRFLVADRAFSCSAAQKGCQGLGKPEGAGGFSTVYLKNDPNRYASSLCQAEAAGCQSWKRRDQSFAYFKDPGAAGCQWRTQVAIGGTSYSGWFRTQKQPVGGTTTLVDTKEECSGYGTWNSNTGTCVAQNGTTVSSCGGIPCNETVCNRGAGGTWNQAANTCLSETPCYGVVRAVGSPAPGGGVVPQITIVPVSTYLIAGTTFGIWQNSDTLYDGRSGACPSAQAGCSEFLDPTDTSNSPEGQPYYFLDNERLTRARAACNGKVSRKEGCVLFDKTDDPAKRWAAQQSYTASDAQQGASVAPVSIPGAEGNNTNVILKVIRDRQCGEWLACQSAQWVWDGLQFKAVCTKLGRCEELGDLAAEENIANCSRWVPVPLLDDTELVDSAIECANPPIVGIWSVATGRCGLGRLTRTAYQARDRGFFGREFTGYSLSGRYPTEKVQEVNLGTISDPYYKLVLVGPPCTTTPCFAGGPGGTCVRGRCMREPPGDFVVTTTTCSSNADCPNSVCVDVTGGDDKCAAGRWRADCRGFPEREAPFPNTERTRVSGAREYQNAPKCITDFGSVATSGEILSCGCNYTKAVYSGQNRYHLDSFTDAPGAICFQGAHDGKSCGLSGRVSREECQNNGGTCQGKTRQLSAVGWQGYCLDTDPSRRINADPDQQECLTWWPIDILPSAPDVYNQFAEAGYQFPDVGGQYWCLWAGPAPEIVIPALQGVDVDAEGGRARIITVEIPDEYDIRKYDIKSFIVDIEGSEFITLPPGGGVVPILGPITDSDAVEIGQYIVEGDSNSEGDRYMNLGGDSSSDKWQNYLARASENEQWWWWAGDDNNSGNSTNSGPERSLGGGLDPSGLTRFVNKLKDYSLTNPDRTIDCSDIAPTSSSSWDGVATMLRFGDETQKLRYVRLVVCTMANDDRVVASVRLRLHPRCDVLARVDPYRSAPRTNNLWGSAGFSVTHSGIIDPIDYVYGTGFPPFGSSSSHEPPPITGTRNPWFLNLNRMEQDRAFGGWPYACQERSLVSFMNSGQVQGVAGPAMCVGGTRDGIGCNTAGSRTSCEAEGGECELSRNERARLCSVNSRYALPAGGTITDEPRYPLPDVNPDNPDTLIEATESLDNLFARSFKVYTWQSIDSMRRPHRGRYIVAEMPSERANGGWDIRAGAGFTTQPQVAALDGSLARITVNGQSEGLVVDQNGVVPIEIKFYGWADDNHMPLRQIVIDWDDGTQTVSNGLYRNHRQANECNGGGFGRQMGVSCDEAYFTYTSVLSCTEGVGPNWQADCPAPEVEGGCCVFKPAVQIRDNWNFCNGGCSPEPCIDEACDIPYNPNPLAPLNGWTPFEGQVVVVPE